MDISKVRKNDLVLVVNPDLLAYGKEMYVLENDMFFNQLKCKASEKLTCTYDYSDFEFVKRPKRNELPEFIK